MHFRQFLKTEFSEENLMFWLACEDLKKETNKTMVEQTVKQIYEDYISVLSPKEVYDSTWLHTLQLNFTHTVVKYGNTWSGPKKEKKSYLDLNKQILFLFVFKKILILRLTNFLQ